MEEFKHVSIVTSVVRDREIEYFLKQYVVLGRHLIQK